MPQEPGKIRNVAVVGHRGTGKTSLVEAMLFQAGKINRLGTVEAGSTVSDWDEDEQRRQMSLAASLAHLEWQGRKINLIDTPGDSGFQADTIASLRVVEGALVVVSGVMGVEVNTSRVWNRAEELELSRVVFVNMLDRERADFYRTLAALQEQLSSTLRRDPAADRRRARADRHRRPAAQLRLHGSRRRRARATRCRSPTRWPTSAAEYREKLLDAVVETDEALMERYLGGEELDPHDDRGGAEDGGHERRALSRSRAASRRRTSARTRCSTCSSRACPSPARKPSPIDADGGTAAFVFKTVADPFAGPHLVLPRLLAAPSPPTRRSSTRATRRRSGSAALMALQGKEHEQADAFGAGDIGAVAKLKDVQTGDVLADAERDVEPPQLDVPRAGDELRGHAEDEGRRGQGRAGACGACTRRIRRCSSAATRRPASSCSRG